MSSCRATNAKAEADASNAADDAAMSEFDLQAASERKPSGNLVGELPIGSRPLPRGECGSLDRTDGEQKRITLTVPYTEDPLARADGALWDGRDRTGAAKDGRSIAVLHVDIGKALLASWPGEPASDYAKRLAEIEAEVARRAKPLPFYYGKVTAVLHEDRRDDLGWLLGQLRATSDALREAQAELARRADPNGTWAKLEALAGKAAGIAAEVDSKG